MVLCSSYRKILLFCIDQCRQLEFSAALAFRGKRLLNHKIKEVDNVAKEFCGAFCSMEPNCVSYNILVSNDSPSITKCEMNNATHFEHPSDLVSFPNSTYRGSKGVFIAAMIRIIEVFSWPIPMSLLQFNFLLVYSHIFYSDCKKPYLLTAVKEMNLKAIFALMNATKTVVKIRPEKFRLVRDLNPWPLRCRCSALSTELTSHVGAGL